MLYNLGELCALVYCYCAPSQHVLCRMHVAHYMCCTLLNLPHAVVQPLVLGVVPSDTLPVALVCVVLLWVRWCVVHLLESTAHLTLPCRHIHR